MHGVTVKLAAYLFSILVTLVGIALLTELGLRQFFPDKYHGYLVEVDGNQVTWRLNPFEPSKPATSFRTPVPVSKPDNVLRVLSLGTSATEGWLSAEVVFNTYGQRWTAKSESSYSRVMEFSINAIAEPSSVRVEVINLGVAAYNMADVGRMLRSSMKLDPDLVVIQLGGNETWTGERQRWSSYIDPDLPYLYSEISYEVYTEIKAGWRTLSTGGSAFNPMALFATGSSPIVVEPAGRDVGLEKRLADYRNELDRLGNFLRRNQIPVLFLLPSQNIGDFEPFGSIARTGIDENQLAELNRLLIEALAKPGSSAKPIYRKVLQIDDGIAEANFQLGKIYLNEQDIDKAREYFWKANDRDLVLKRIPSAFHAISKDFLAHYNFPFLDEMAFYESISETGIVGFNWLGDDVHPNRSGQFQLGQKIVEIIVKQDMLPSAKYAGNIENLPTLQQYNAWTGFDEEEAGIISFLEAAHNYLAFGRYRQRIKWHPDPDSFLAPIIEKVAIANTLGPSDQSLFFGAALNLYTGNLDAAESAIASLQCHQSAERSSAAHKTMVQTYRQITSNTRPQLEETLKRILTNQGCKP